jgi:hypothetical protein
VPPGLIHQVQANHHAIRDLQHLKHKVQVPLEPRGIHHDDRHVRAAEQHKVSSHFFVRTGCQQRIGARKVHQLERRPAVGETAFGSRDRLAGPIARVLP